MNPLGLRLRHLAACTPHVRTPPARFLPQALPHTGEPDQKVPANLNLTSRGVAGLENRYGRFRPSRVRIPPSPLAVKSGRFFPTAYLRIARRHWRFTLPLPRDFPTAAPLSIPGRAGLAAITAPVSRPAHRVIIRSRRRRDSPSLLEVSTCGRSLARRREGVVGGSLPHSCPELLPVRDVLARHAQRTSPQYRRTARHARVARRSLPRGIPRLSKQIGAQLNAQVLTEREML